MITIAATAKALSAPFRLQILHELLGGEQCVCTLQEALAIQQSLLSHHLALLRESGIVQSRKEGKWVYYSINTTALRAIHSYIQSLLAAKNNRHSC